MRKSLAIASFLLSSSTVFSADKILNHNAKFDADIVDAFPAEAAKRGFLDRLLSWPPNGGPQGRVSPECDEREIEKGFLKFAKDLNGQNQFIKSYFAKCGPELRARFFSPLISLAQEHYIRPGRFRSDEVQHIRFNDIYGSKIRADLYLKRGEVPRPLVIFRCGLQCNLGTASAIITTQQMAEESPFHLLITGSVTGSDYQTDNKMVSFGGYEEGRQLIELARYASDSKRPYAKKISSIHILGTSLGGAATLYANFYNRYYPDEQGRPLVKSFFAGCPVVDLKTSVVSLLKPNIVGRTVYKNIVTQSLALIDVIPFMALAFPDGKNPALEEVPGLLAEGAAIEYRARTADVAWRPIPFKDAWIRTPEDFWKVNRFQDYADQLKDPVMIWSAADDKVVRADQNTDLLLKNGQGRPNANYSILRSPEGGHCDFWAAYGWAAMGSVFRSWVLANSPEFLARRHWVSRRVNFPRAFALGSLERQGKFIWRAKAGSSKARLSLSIQNLSCSTGSPGHPIANTCQRWAEVSVDLNALGLSAEDFPRDKAEAEALTRYLNRNIFVSGQRSGRLEKNEFPKQLEWAEYR